MIDILFLNYNIKLFVIFVRVLNKVCHTLKHIENVHDPQKEIFPPRPPFSASVTDLLWLPTELEFSSQDTSQWLNASEQSHRISITNSCNHVVKTTCTCLFLLIHIPFNFPVLSPKKIICRSRYYICGVPILRMIILLMRACNINVSFILWTDPPILTLDSTYSASNNYVSNSHNKEI